MNYVDGFLIPLPKKNLAVYKRLAQAAAKIWMEHGALEFHECAGDDLKTHCGLSFPQRTKARAGETVMFSYIVYKSRAHRDKVNAKVMADPRIQAMCAGKEMPFDSKRMSYGGFKGIVSARRRG